MIWLSIGAICFGAVVGWITRYTLAFAKEITINSLVTVIGAVGGAAITKLFDPKSSGYLFAAYSIGLAFGFFMYVLLYDIDPLTGAVTRGSQRPKRGGNTLKTPVSPQDNKEVAETNTETTPTDSVSTNSLSGASEGETKINDAV